jgi:hypothetical protein
MASADRLSAMMGRMLQTRRLVRAPILLYGLRIGFLPGHRMLLLQHRGRNIAPPDAADATLSRYAQRHPRTWERPRHTLERALHTDDLRLPMFALQLCAAQGC